MFGFLRNRILISTSNVEEKERITDALAENNVKFFIRVKDTNSRNSFDELKYGFAGNSKPKYLYTFYVDKDDLELALHLI